MHTEFGGKNLKGQEKLRRPRKRWEDNIETEVNIRKGGRKLDLYGSE
jgi:hypothetical protein